MVCCVWNLEHSKGEEHEETAFTQDRCLLWLYS